MKLAGCGRCLCLSVTNNPASIRLVGLCPILATTTSVIKATTMCVMLLAVMLMSNAIASALRASVVWRLKPIYFAVIASICVMLTVNVATILVPAVLDALSIYPLLLAANCLILSGMQEFAEHQTVARSVRVSLIDGLGICAMLLVIALCREFAAHGHLFHDFSLLLGAPVNSVREFQGMLPILGEPPGALLMLGLLLALGNALRARHPAPMAMPQER